MASAPVPGVQKPFLKKAPGGPPPQFERRPAPTVNRDYRVDENARFSGTVTAYHHEQGYGFLRVNQPNVVPGDQLFVHWTNIQTDDRYPFLIRGQTLEFGVMKWYDKNRWNESTTLRAKHVTLPGGEMIANQDAEDARTKVFVGNQFERFTGMLKFYSPEKAFGFVTLDDGYDHDQPVPKELRVEEREVNCVGKKPEKFMQNVRVEFGIHRVRSRFFVYNMTLPGGAPMLQENMEGRQTFGAQSYSGTVSSWSLEGNWGFIAVAPSAMLPTKVEAKVKEMQEDAKKRGKAVQERTTLYFRKPDCAQGCKPQKGLHVNFRVYIDDKGAGACDVSG